jgi:hypothetical protein
VKYIMAGAGFLVVGAVVAAACGFLWEMLGPQFIIPGTGIDWGYLPWIVLGFYAGVHSWRATLRVAEEKRLLKQSKP